jgi:hypothetical protein
MREDFLYYVWQLGHFDHRGLKTTMGEEIEIIRRGERNTLSGPDFCNARIRIGDTIWVGNVEIHINASDWVAHKHTQDPAYRNVVLHVVLEEDSPVLTEAGIPIPCLELKQRIEKDLLGRYQRLMRAASWIPCQQEIHSVPEVVRKAWLDRLLVERLARRTEKLAARLKDVQGDWEELFYQTLAQGLGGHVNAQPFEMLARSLPLHVLLRYRHSRLQLEALFFGQANLLAEGQTDDYPQRLLQEYTFLKAKHSLTPLPVGMWKFMRMRPANFPTIRIAQLAALIYHRGTLLNHALSALTVAEMEIMLSVRLANYWTDHFVFDKQSKPQPKLLGKEMVNLLVVNAIVPTLFLYGMQQGGEKFQQRAIALLEDIPAEKNVIIDGWKKLGMDVPSAFHSQALLELKNEYCSAGKCLQCAMGNVILTGISPGMNIDRSRAQ